MSELKERLLQAREWAGKTQNEVAEAIGIKQPSYAALESGESKSTGKVVQIAIFLRVRAAWLAMGEGEPFEGALRRINDALLQYGGDHEALIDLYGVTRSELIGWSHKGIPNDANVWRKIESMPVAYSISKPSEHLVAEPLPAWNRKTPIVGTAQLGVDGYWHELDYPTGHGDGYVDAPSNDPNAYALKVKGDSMAPAIRNGWIVVIEPNTPIFPGELVVCCIKDGQCMVKEFLYERDSAVTLGSINQDHKPVTVDRADITRFHHLAAILPPSKWQPI